MEELRSSEPDLIVEDLGVLQELLEEANWDWEAVLEKNSGVK